MYDEGLSIPERLAASLSVTVNIDNYVRYLAVRGRVSGMTWEEVATPLQVTRQTAYARYGNGLPDDAQPVVRVTTGVVHPDGNAVWYGLEGDLPRERNYAYSRPECETAYRLARARADARVKELGPAATVDDGGIDRGSGLFWDLYVGL
jgi:hypothetical protein